MGNRFALRRPSWCSCARAAAMAKQQKVLRVVKTDGKILEFSVPILVKDLLVKFSGLGVGVSKEASQHLPLNHKLKTGKIYYLLPLASPAGAIDPAGISSMDNPEQTCGSKRIKVVITKQQLKELMSKQVISLEEVLSGLEKTACSMVSSTNWKPKLESIAEGSE
ncbi:hypothetical protein L1049_020543 [Liquidambar formosana]|uniref:Uncharacterized protein n=1 Tax=Liquidambar formosana TaxID=63359 RepID=A0AAP0X418_LIQFO